MKIIQSFWSKPFNKKKELNDSDRAKGGWLYEKMFYVSIALSCLNLKKFYDDVTLVTDEFGKHMLIDILELPYSNIIVELDNINHYHEDLWALGKIYAYSIQNEPFLHIDNDVYIWRPFDEKLIGSELIFQNFEKSEPYYQNICDQIKNNNFIVPSEMQQYVDDHGKFDSYSGVNAGILGGKDITFFKEYTDLVFGLIDKNYKSIHKIDRGLYNVFYEQSLFYCLAKDKKMNMGYLFETIGPDFEEVTEICMVPNSWYIHVIGGWKKNIKFNENIYLRLSLDYPKYLHKINSVFQKN